MKVSKLAGWYREHGRHTLAWRATRDRWTVLVSEVMLHQTQVPRVAAVFDAFIAQFPTPAAMAAAGPAAVITAWGRLGYPRRARRLWEAAGSSPATAGPPISPSCPGVGRYTAAAVAAQADDDDRVGIEVNVRRVVRACARAAAHRPGSRGRASASSARVSTPRDRLLALMDLGATVCAARTPRCERCPLVTICATRGTHVRRDEASPGTVRGLVPPAPRHRDGAAARRAPSPPASSTARCSRRCSTTASPKSRGARTPSDARRRRGSSPAAGARRSVRIDSGWNCTPSIGNSRWRRPITRPSSDSAVISSTSGTVSRATTREW